MSPCSLTRGAAHNGAYLCRELPPRTLLLVESQFPCRMEIRRNSPVLEKHLSKETALLLHSVQQSWLALDSTTSIGRNTTSIALEPNVQSHADTNCDSDGCSLLVCHLFAHAACDRQTIHVFAAPVTSTYPLCEALCRRTHVRRGSSRARRRIILFAAQVRGQ